MCGSDAAGTPAGVAAGVPERPARRRTSAQVVIGANYGDEGKGLITDYLAALAGGDAVVIRFNSSAQAGHTVVTPDGRRHVFHHVGAGTLAGASTLLSRFFVAHPMLLGEELAALEGLGVRPDIHVDPRARVATPYDVMLNQLAEEARGDAPHGSCGIGFNEAVERSLRPKFVLTVADLADRGATAMRLRAVRDVWVPRRLAVLGLAPPDDMRGDLLRGDALIARWLQDAEAFVDATRCVEPGEKPPGRVIFEGAQGLLLDQDGPDFPHVTRSKTGLSNVVRLAQEMEIETLDVTYVSRTYLTRHGAGPLRYEMPRAPAGVCDPTNVPNRYQGPLRFGRLDIDALAARIRADLAFRAGGIGASAGLALTCLDQTPEGALCNLDGGTGPLSPEALDRALSYRSAPPLRLVSTGPCRTAVRRWR